MNLSWLPWERNKLPLLFTVMLAMALVEFSRSAFFVTYLPPLAKTEWGLGLAAVGFAASLHYYSETASKVIGGVIAQRFGLRALTVMAGLFGYFSLWAVPYVTQPWMLWGLAIIWGFGLAGLGPAMVTLASFSAVKGREGRAVSYTTSLVMPASGIGLLVGYQLQGNLEFLRSILMVTSLCAAALIVVLWNVRLQVSSPKKDLYPWRKLLIFIPAAFLWAFAPNVLQPVIVKFANLKLGLSVLDLIIVLGLGGAVMFVGMAYFGRYADRVSPRLPLVLGLITYGFGAFLITQGPNFIQLLGIAVMLGVGFAMFTPAWNALVVRALPEQNRAAVWATLMTVEGIGIASGPAIGGFVAEHYGIQAPFIVSTIAFLIVSVFYVVVFVAQDRRKRRV